jgi:hypothetical protein
MISEGAQGGGQGGVAGIPVAALEFRKQGAATFDAAQEGGKGGRGGRSVV